MKKWLPYLLILIAVSLLGYGGFGGEDLGKLYPVQTLMLSADQEGVRLLTDGGQQGKGMDALSALEDLKATAAAQVFLDTADYLLLEPGVECYLPQLQQFLRPGCNVCYVSGPVQLQEVSGFLEHHPPVLTLTQYAAGEGHLPTLIYNEGRMSLVRS